MRFLQNMTVIRRSLFELLDCETRRLLRQRAVWGWAAWYVTLVMAFVYPTLIYSGSRTGLASLRSLNLLVAIVIPTFGTCRIVEDLASGTLMLMKVAAVSSTEWIVFRLLSTAVAYLTVWIIRIPIYSFVLFTGLATLEDLLWSEALTWCVMVGYSQITLLAARYSETEQAAIGASFGLICAFNALFFVPIFVVLLLHHLGGITIPPVVRILAEFSRDSSILMHLFNSPATPEGRLHAVIAMSITMLLGLLASFWLRRLLFVQPELESVQATPLISKRQVTLRRPSRRVWDDAFA